MREGAWTQTIRRPGGPPGPGLILRAGQLPPKCQLAASGAVLAILTLVMPCLSACSTGTNLIGKDQLALIKIGQSSKREVRQLLGEPRAVSASNVVGERGETWVYPLAKKASDAVTGVPPIGVEGVPISRMQRSTTFVEISFDEKGVVSSLIESRVDVQAEDQTR